MGTVGAAGPIGRGRRGEAVAVLAAAFHDDGEAAHLLPDARRRARVVPRFLADECADSERHGTLFGVDVGGRLAGVAAWLGPDAYPIPLGRQVAQAVALVPLLPWALGAAAEARRGQAAVRAHHPTEPHWFLRVLGVAPEHQGTGIGRRLIEPGLERADAERVGSHLFTTVDANVRFYGRFGYEVAQTFHPTPTWPKVWSLWREPR